MRGQLAALVGRIHTERRMSEATFVKNVRGGQVRRPDQHGFSLATWDAAYRSTEQPCESDERLFIAGRFIFGRLDGIRGLLARSRVPGFTADELRQLLCGCINRDAHLLLAVRPTGEANEVPVSNLVEGKMNLPSGIAARPGAVLEGLIDGARLCLSDPPVAAGREDRRYREDDAIVLGKLRLVINLAGAYSWFQELWNECLWNGWYVEEAPGLAVIRAPDESRERARAVGRHRLDVLIVELTQRGIAVWRTLSAQKRANVGQQLQEVTLRGSGRRRTIGLRAAADGDVPPTRLLLRLQATELYLEELVRRPFPADGALSVNRLLDAWAVVASLSEAFVKRFPSDSSCYTLGKLREYAPSIADREMIRVLARALRCEMDVAARVLEYFVFAGTPRAGLWSAPLLRLPGRLLPLVGAAQLPNVFRTLEEWLGKSGIQVSERGPLFEEHCRAVLRREFRNAPVLRRAGVLGRSVEVTGHTGKEQIDLLLWIGSTIVVGELKSLPDVAQPFEVYTTLREIERAADQAKRKAEAVRAHPEEVCAATTAEHGVVITVKEVVPVILTTLPVWSGLVVADVPAVDLLILRTFISRPSIDRWVALDCDGREATTGAPQIILYASEEEAENKLAQYLTDPPQLECYRAGLTLEDGLMPPLTAGDRACAARAWVVAPPGEQGVRFVVGDA